MSKNNWTGISDAFDCYGRSVKIKLKSNYKITDEESLEIDLMENYDGLNLDEESWPSSGILGDHYHSKPLRWKAEFRRIIGSVRIYNSMFKESIYYFEKLETAKEFSEQAIEYYKKLSKGNK